jgi:phosphoglycerate kinase
MDRMSKLSIRDLDLTGKRVLIRVDFNVPLSKDDTPRILDDTRIRETIPTIEYALRRKARVILCSHLGRPKGQVVPAMSLRPVVDRLRELLDHVLGEDENVAFAPDCIGEIAQELVANLEPGQTLLLENLRFHAEEEANDPAFAEKLASLCDLFVNDAFGSAHRAHASTEGITHFVAQSAAGLLMESELKHLGKALNQPDKPFVAIIGGAKVSDKITVIESLMTKADAILIGGGMAYTFLRAQDQQTGKSLVEEDKIEVARATLAEAARRGVKFLLPVDHCLADRFDARANSTLFSGDGAFPEDLMALDIGPATEALFAAEIASAQTILWNGPMGVFEFPAFAHGTNAIAKAVASNPDATSIVGGGDSVSAIHKSGFADKITHISTGGGASLEFLEGKTLPGVEALTEKP